MHSITGLNRIHFLAHSGSESHHQLQPRPAQTASHSRCQTGGQVGGSVGRPAISRFTSCASSCPSLSRSCPPTRPSCSACCRLLSSTGSHHGGTSHLWHHPSSHCQLHTQEQRHRHKHTGSMCSSRCLEQHQPWQYSHPFYCYSDNAPPSYTGSKFYLTPPWVAE